MVETWKVLLASRKFWVGLISVVCVIAAVTLRALDKIPADALVPTIASLTAIAGGFMLSTAWEDVATKSVQAAASTRPSPAPTQTVNVATTMPATPVSNEDTQPLRAADPNPRATRRAE
jgi:hypothetical protein